MKPTPRVSGISIALRRPRPHEREPRALRTSISVRRLAFDSMRKTGRSGLEKPGFPVYNLLITRCGPNLSEKPTIGPLRRGLLSTTFYPI